MYYPNYHQADPALINDVAKAINGEYSAISCYERLANIAPSAEEKKQINEIINDEKRHFQIFSQIYMSLTGRQPTPRINEPCPSEYIAGLHFSFRDEQNTVDFYNEIADKSNDPYVSEPFRRAALDEQNHAVWFLYFLSLRR